MRSNVNLSRMARAAGCCGVGRIICTGPARLERKIARDGADTVQVEIHRTLPPVLDVVARRRLSPGRPGTDHGLAQPVLLPVRSPHGVGSGQRASGLTDDILARLDDVVEIPVWGLPYSHNVATAAAMALYEYCRQYPEG